MASDLIQFKKSEKEVDENRITTAVAVAAAATADAVSVAAVAAVTVAVPPVEPKATLSAEMNQESESDSIKVVPIVADTNDTVVPPSNVPAMNEASIEHLEKNSTERTSPHAEHRSGMKLAETTTTVNIDNILTLVPEKSVTHIKECGGGEFIVDEIHEVPLNEEAADHLSPLMMDNHTVLEHQESFKSLRNLDMDQIPEFVPSYPTLKHSESLNSTESDIPVLMDRRNSQESSNPSGYSSDGLSSDENAKDSGCDVKPSKSDQENDSEPTEPLEIPDEETCEKIVTQVEYYFSNESILKDAFLLKHVRRNKEGFVSLKLISSFKRVRQITKDWRAVGYAIKLKSKIIEVNDVGTKVRRLDALPAFDETMPSRTVVATNLPFDKVTIEKISDVFSKCGEIALIRILRPGGAIPADVRQFINKYPELHQRYCALVEFTESQYARNAMDLDNNMQIFEMVAPKKKTGKKATIAKIIENYKFSHSDVERSRGGSAADDFKFNNFRRGSGYFAKQQIQQHLQQQPQHDGPNSHQFCQPRRFSYTNNENYDNFNRRASTCSNGSDSVRKYSNCSEGYSSCAPSDISRRASMCSESSRRQSQCSDVSYRRASNCSDFCICTRRTSQCSEAFRRISQCSEHNRRFSNGSISYERRMSNGPIDTMRRVSFDSEYDRKLSNGSMTNGNINNNNNNNNNNEIYRKVINQNGQYPLDRKCSNDSGYDRRLSSSSVISDYAPAPRYISNGSTNGAAATKAESLVRTPIGPDGSKGFSMRARKVGQVAGPA